MIRIIFFGTENFAVPILHTLISDSRFSVVAVVTKPDQPVGRGHTLTALPVKLAAVAAGVHVLQPEKLSDSTFFSALTALKAELGVVVQYGKIIPSSILSQFSDGVVNVHGSLLPKYRGPSPIQTALLSGETKTGITIMLLDEEMDHGPILSQERLVITTDDTSETLFIKLAEIGAKLLPETIMKFVGGTLTPQAQDHNQATYTKIIEREDGRVTGNETPDELERKLRAFIPWPGLFTEYKNKRVKILKIIPLSAARDSNFHEHRKPGTWWKTAENLPAITVHNGSILLLEVQPEGKNRIAGVAFVRGYLK